MSLNTLKFSKTSTSLPNLPLGHFTKRRINNEILNILALNESELKSIKQRIKATKELKLSNRCFEDVNNSHFR